MEYMDSSVKTPENVEAELQIHGLGLVPELPNVDGDSLAISDEYPMFKESIVSGTNLVLRREDQGILESLWSVVLCRKKVKA